VARDAGLWTGFVEGDKSRGKNNDAAEEELVVADG
jgi:hypothetical protein